MQVKLSELTIDNFLYCPTPQAWIDKALQHIPLLLVDHAHCERKAALSAISMMNNYPEHPALQMTFSQLAREELLHFEKVLQLLTQREIRFHHLQACRYAKTLIEAVRPDEPARLIDKLIVGAIIEARSAERFLSLIPHLDPELSKFYESLVKSETRHFVSYLSYAKDFSKDDITKRVDFFLTIERELIESEETMFRFHSGC